MMDRKEKILAFINDENYVPMRKKDIIAIMSVPREDTDELDRILDELINEGKILITTKNKYMPVNPNEYVTGVFRANERGFGFVLTQDDEEDIFIMSEHTLNAMNGDTVLVQITHKANRDKKREGRIVRIITHANTFVTGTYKAGKSFGFVIPDDKKLINDIYIPKSKNADAQHNNKVVVHITQWPRDGKKAEGEITEILGFAGDIGIDVLCVLKRFGIEEEFPQKVLEQADRISNVISEKEFDGREDFRSSTVITIDGADSKDLDDAISVQKTNYGYRLAVHIADVTHYVTENSPLDKEAMNRGTSVYFTDRVVPMLPKKLSNGICSLNPNEDRLTLSVVMDIDSSGSLTSHYITEGIIKSCERMTYDDVTKIIEGDTQLCDKYQHIYSDIMNMYELSLILMKKRKSAGSIDFDFPETKITVDESGKPIDVYKYTPGVSNKIIEEFMLMANKTVAENFYWLDAPFVYRVHEKPSAEKVTRFNDFLKPMNLHIHGNEPHPMEFSKMLGQIKGSDKELLISKVMLRSLMKARYSPQNAGHFGLAFTYYCHFTSPIRRYPDLAIHRIIKEYLKYGIGDTRRMELENFVAKAADKSSEAEVNAMEAERAVEDMKKAEYMKNHIGEEFEAIISSVTNFGFFAELDNGIEGLVRVADLRDDYYIFNDADFTLTGEHSGKTYKIGDKLNIIVANANVQLAQIDFYPAEE
ncbi:MAG: ribonuclease R [Clostridia bacterium]|nr:ribonuclease R [Clostridia bacterium]